MTLNNLKYALYLNDEYLLRILQYHLDLVNKRLDETSEDINTLTGVDIEQIKLAIKALKETDIEKINQNITDLQYEDELINNRIKDHKDNGIIHVTQTDKDLWNATLQNAKDYAKQLFDGVTSFDIELVSILPTGDDIKEMVIYFVPNLSNDTANYYDEYMYINDKWEIVGNTKIDLTPYVKTDELSKTLQDYVLMSSLTTTLRDYVTNTNLSTVLKDYSLKTDSHSHSNKNVLDLLSCSDGKLLYDNKEISSEETLTNQQIEEAIKTAINEINS